MRHHSAISFALAATAWLSGLYSATTFALHHTDLPAARWAVFAGLGGGDYSNATNGQSFQLSSVERDFVHNHKQKHLITYTIGALKYMPFSGNRYLSAWGVGAVMTHHATTISGMVQTYGDPTLQNYRYRYRVQPYSLFAQAMVKGRCWMHCLYPYAFASVGISLMKLMYTENAVDPAAAVGALSGDQWKYRPAFQVGAGLGYKLSSHWSLGLRYVYQSLAHPAVLAYTTDGGAHAKVPVQLGYHGGYVTLQYQY